jgi:hypothetical protein
MPKIFKCSFVSEGQFYAAGTPIAEDDIKPFMLKYEEKPQPKASAEQERNLNYKLNEFYSLDENGNRLPHIRREMAEMRRQAMHEERMEEELMNSEESQAVKDAIEIEREKHAAEVAHQKAAMEYRAKMGDSLDESLMEEQDAAVASGEFDAFDRGGKVSTFDEYVAASDSEKATPTGGRGALGKKPTAEKTEKPTKPGRPAPVNPQPSSNGTKKSKLFVCRDANFLPSSSVALIPGETLYRRRPRSFGVAAKWIKHGTVK